MAQFRTPHPWDPGFALPANVLAEPPGRGTLVTAQLPRKTISGRPMDWTGGYAVPQWILDEPSGRGVYWTKSAQRKTIQQSIPGSLGDVDQIPKPGFPGDPIKAYGHRASEVIMNGIRTVPPEFRLIALESLLNELESGLYAKVTTKATEYEKRGMSAKKAVKAAIASQMSAGLAAEMLKLGRGKSPKPTSLVGLGCYGGVGKQIALDGLWSSIKSAASKVASTTKSAVTTVARGVSYPIRKTASGVRTAATWTASKVKSAANKALDFGKKALDKLGKLACGVMNHPAAPLAGGAAAAAAGAPPQTGVVAAQVGKSVCTDSNVPPTPPQQLMQPMFPSWVLPAAIAGGGALALILLTKKR